MSWTDERVEQLTKLWGEGLSASQIAKELGGVTRNAVIGKVHRLGLSGRAKPSNAGSRPRKAVDAVETQQTTANPETTRPAATSVPIGGGVAGNVAYDMSAAPEAEEARAPDVAGDEQVERCTILSLTEHTCRWPIGDPGSEDFHFCGQRPKPGLPYCEFHARIAYQASAPRGVRRDDRQKLASA